MNPAHMFLVGFSAYVISIAAYWAGKNDRKALQTWGAIITILGWITSGLFVLFGLVQMIYNSLS